MRISDWSSDVCSSDLRRREGDRQSAHAPDTVERPPRRRSGSSRVLDALRNQMQTFVDLRARDVLTEAHMHAETERHVPVFPGTVRLKVVRIAELARICSRQAHRKKPARPAGPRSTTQ